MYRVCVVQVVGTNIPPEYIPSCEKGAKDAVEKGPLVGHPAQVSSKDRSIIYYSIRGDQPFLDGDFWSIFSHFRCKESFYTCLVAKSADAPCLSCLWCVCRGSVWC